MLSPDTSACSSIPVLQGHRFENTDRDGRPSVAIINEAAAHRFWPNQNPIGARIWFGGGSRPTGPLPTQALRSLASSATCRIRKATIAGTSRRLHVVPAVHLLVPRGDGADEGDPAAAMRGIRDAVKRVDPDIALYDLGLLTEQLGGDGRSSVSRAAC